jgi:Icc-related predicted phosphoesterase
MKLAILSDLHLEFFRGQALPKFPTDADVVILAGDIHLGARGVDWAGMEFRQRVIMTMGNHEAYDQDLAETIRGMRDAAVDTNVRVLENDIVEIGGVRFIGCTLWTDFALWGPASIDEAFEYADKLMTDYRLIRVGQRPLRAADTRTIHLASRKWLEDALAKPHDGPTVVVTHHLPSKRSVAEKFLVNQEDSWLSAAFASSLDELIERFQPEIWVHGHTHESCDYKIGKTRVVCNPRGYRHEMNPQFDPNLTVTL